MPRIDTIRNEITNPPENRKKFLLYTYVGYMRWYDKFIYHDRTIAQLKNGGSFRLIRNSTVAELLIEYDATVNTNIKDIETISNDLWQQVNYLQNKIFSTQYFSIPLQQFNIDSALKIDSRPIEIKEKREEELFEYYNMLDYYRGLNMARNIVHAELISKASNLVTMIKREYHLQ